jgi:hypothetical protein
MNQILQDWAVATLVAPAELTGSRHRLNRVSRHVPPHLCDGLRLDGRGRLRVDMHLRRVTP